jgi:cyclic di-GMP phosphodiesterase
MSRILVVEDDPSTREVVAGFLEDVGYEVVAATNEDEGVTEINRDGAFHVVITDMHMNSKTGGRDVLKAARKRDELTQIIILTGFGYVEDAVKCMEEGAFTYLEKRGDKSDYKALVQKVKKALEHRRKTRLSRSLRGFTKAFGAAIELNDPHTKGHSSKVAYLTLKMAKELGMDEDQQEDAWLAAAIHDVGKIAVDAAVLTSVGKLSADEIQSIRAHPDSGHRIVEGIEELNPLARSVRDHHERYDGDTAHPERPAYPGVVDGKDIDQFARLIAVADTYDAITSKRPAEPVADDKDREVRREKALGSIRNERGARLDPDVVDAFLRLADRGEV